MLTGSDDRIVPPANASILARAIPGARLVTIAGGGHMVLFTHLRDSIDAIGGFLDLVDAERRAA